MLYPLYDLLNENKRWICSVSCESAFIRVKKILASALFLVHYNPNLPLRLITDASDCGVGALVAHIMPDGMEKVIAYVSSTLLDREKSIVL